MKKKDFTIDEMLNEDVVILHEGRTVRISDESMERIFRARAAIMIAKRNNDPLYIRAMLFKEKHRHFLEKN